MLMKERFMIKAFRSLCLVTAFSMVAVWSVAPVQSVQAQTRALPDFADLVDQVGPSVVNIRTIERVTSRARPGSSPDEEMLEFFRRFGMPLPNIPRQTPRQNRPETEQEQPRGVGSGFILSADGLIMTNAHVVDGADDLIVTLTDKREFRAKVIGADKRSDVAVLKIEATGLPTVKIGDVNRLRVGEWVMAIGSPFGLDSTVTAGIVSAKQRDTGEYLPLIQTDVAINPGNSGGPLINLRGEVVGINSQIYSRSGGFMGISFAIPIDEAVRVSDQLRTFGRVSRGRIGVQIENVSKEMADNLGLGKPTGAFVRAVEADSPAEKAGVEAGDVITKFDGKVIDKSSDLPRTVGSVKPGTKTTVTVFRRGQTRDLSIVIAEVEGDKPTVKAQGRDDKKPSVAQELGLSVLPLTDAERKQIGVKGGVKVESVQDAAARAGLREGDVIVAILDTEILNIKDFESVLAKYDKKRPLTILYRRGEWTIQTVIRPNR
jgi:serine protease Do